MARQERKSVRLDEAIASYLKKLEPEKLSQASLASKDRTLRVLTETVGRVNRSVRKLAEDDFDRCLTSLAVGLTPEENAARRRKGLGARTGRSPRTLAADRSTLQQFVEYCQHMGWMRPGFNPMFRVTQSKRGQGDMDPAKVRKRRSVPMSEWPALLQAAGEHHPRTRMIVAAGLMLGRRASEIDYMQWKHFSLDRGVDEEGEPLPDLVFCFNLKRGRPVNSGGTVVAPWLRAELDRWRAWVEAEHGPVQPDWYVCPAKLRISDPRVTNALDTASYPVEPTQRMTPRHVTDDTQEALWRAGWTDEDMYGEGGHTLRRSFSQMMQEFGGLEAAQAGLDHENPEQTQHYSGNRAGHRALNRTMAKLKAPEPGKGGSDNVAPNLPPAAPAAAPTVPAQAEAPEVEKSNVVDFMARLRAKQAG